MKIYRIARVVALVAVAMAAWLATLTLGFMCLFSVILGPLSIGVFVVTVAVAGLAVSLSAIAVKAASGLWDCHG